MHRLWEQSETESWKSRPSLPRLEPFNEVCGICTKSLRKPQDVQKTHVALAPGWSECIKPVVGTDSCQAHHIGVVQSGRMHVVHEDGSEGEIGAGESYIIEPGHDAWVVGDETFVGFEFDSSTAGDYAKGAS